MPQFLELLLALLAGGLLVANVPFLQKLFSIEEFFLGLQRGLTKGEEMRGGKREVKRERNQEKGGKKK